tara:strand:+ start:7518 stop:8543 length:1026 start_codon:yes stop_codon:yes gene_type:complete
MGVSLSEDYVAQKFLQYAGYAKYKKYNSVYEGGCNVCNEGKSWGRKRRLYYIPKKELIFCQNCGWSSRPLKWISHSTGMSVEDILAEAKQESCIDLNHDLDRISIGSKHNDTTLPDDSINLFDPIQIRFYRGTPMVLRALDYIKLRKLDVAVNRPKSLWISLSDYTHQNRLVLPFYENGKIIHYQTRSITDDGKPSYLSKVNSDKPLFNYDNIDSDLDYIFICEGPIDSFFVQNGVAVAGIQKDCKTDGFNSSQRSQLDRFIGLKPIWVLDSQHLDETSMKRSLALIERGDNVFIWPKDFGMKFKDLNEMACSLNIKKIPSKFILKNTYSGMKAKYKLLVP